MKSLVTGAGGFVGPHLVAHLTELGDEVVPLNLDSGPDLRDSAAWAETIAAHRPDVIYHLAGWSDVGGSWANPIATLQINAVGTAAVLEAARLADTGRVLVVSSADVYGTVTEEALPIAEDRPTEPKSPYGASKQAAETLARHYWQGFGLETVIARPFNHIGPGQSLRFAAPAFASQIATAEVLRRADVPGELHHGDLTPERDFTDVRDVVRAYRYLMTDGDPGEVYNVCSGRTVSMRRVLDRLLALSDVTIEAEVDPSLIRPIEIPVLRGSFTKLHRATGWEPEIDLDRTLADVLDDARRRQRVSLTR